MVPRFGSSDAHPAPWIRGDDRKKGTEISGFDRRPSVHIGSAKSEWPLEQELLRKRPIMQRNHRLEIACRLPQGAAPRVRIDDAELALTDHAVQQAGRMRHARLAQERAVRPQHFVSLLVIAITRTTRPSGHYTRVGHRLRRSPGQKAVLDTCPLLRAPLILPR